MEKITVLDLKIELNEDFTFNVIRKINNCCSDLVNDFCQDFVCELIATFLNDNDEGIL